MQRNHTDLQTKHTDLQFEHSKLQTAHTNLNAAHTRVVGDKKDLQVEASNVKGELKAERERSRSMQQRSQTTIDGLTKELQGHKQTIKQLETAAESQTQLKGKKFASQQQQFAPRTPGHSDCGSVPSETSAVPAAPIPGAVAAVLCVPASTRTTSTGVQASTSVTCTGMQASAATGCAGTQADFSSSHIVCSDRYKAMQKRCAWMKHRVSSQRCKIRNIRAVLADRENTLEMVQGAMAE
jgi:hypothetical protein